MTIRESLEQQEDLILCDQATFSRRTRGRPRPEPACDIRPAFQHDRDRVLHCKAFRRLKHKTQVFLAPAGDHYRTRLTHTLEVSQIGRTLARALRLNESLVEAIALAHDLGHTPFGHAGETVLARLRPGGFHHSLQSLRVVDFLEKAGQGLNLTHEVRDGILQHTKGKGDLLLAAAPLEAQVVRISDAVAYLTADADDAVRAGVLTPEDIPEAVRRTLGETHGMRIDTMVRDVVRHTLERGLEAVVMGPEVHEATMGLREFLYERVYDNPAVHGDFVKATKILEELYDYFLRRPDWFLDNLAQPIPGAEIEDLATDFIAGMTDRYALALYENLFMPQPWKVF
ncbi:MAG: deoxyguanosinetriphosphate triphosphohydrolase [Deltaproteobacteria bacterium]|nr:deoxyguanosinetriphosphate triphosphohydrolase [Deltaproteobacteria bacterium]